MQIKKDEHKDFSKCKGCGKCCYNVPLPKDLVKVKYNKIVNHPKQWILYTEKLPEYGKYLSNGIENVDTLLPDNEDGRCPFLTNKNICNIYQFRPRICRDYGKGGHPFLICPILEGKADTPAMPAMNDQEFKTQAVAMFGDLFIKQLEKSLK